MWGDRREVHLGRLEGEGQRWTTGSQSFSAWKERVKEPKESEREGSSPAKRAPRVVRRFWYQGETWEGSLMLLFQLGSGTHLAVRCHGGKWPRSRSCSTGFDVSSIFIWLSLFLKRGFFFYHKFAENAQSQICGDASPKLSWPAFGRMPLFKTAGFCHPG